MNEADATRERVLNAAEDLDYGGPDPLASSLRQGPSGIVGVFAEGPLLNSFSDPFAVSVLDRLTQHLGQNSSGILLIPAQGSDGREVVRRISGIPSTPASSRSAGTSRQRRSTTCAIAASRSSARATQRSTVSCS